MELVEQIIKEWKQNKAKPIYWLDGEEDYYIDLLTNYAEDHLLTAQEAEFNKDVFYGKDTTVGQIISSCRQFPMFAEKRLVLIKEAQQLSKLDDLKLYVEQPVPSTILIVAHKQKKLDGKTSLAKLLQKKATVLTTKALYENQLPQFAQQIITQKGFTIAPKALHILVNNIGNNLNRIANEINKLCINITHKKNIDENDVETYVGVSKEYNVFAFQEAVGKKELPRMLAMIQYFEANPKAAPMELVLSILYGFFGKVFAFADVAQMPDSAIASQLKVNPYFVKDYKMAYQKYGAKGVEKAILLLHQYSCKNLGIGAAATNDSALLKELCVKLMLCN
jgi:DNA polymerase III subunit delta